MTRPVATWWGLAALGPEATMAKQNSSWVSRMRLLDVAGQSCSLRPAQRSLGQCLDHPVDGRRHPGQGLDLLGSLRIRSCLVTAEAGREAAAGRAVLEPQQEGAPQPVAHPSRPPAAPAAVRVSTTSRTGSSVSGHAPPRPPRSPQLVAGQRRLQGRHDQPGVAGRRQPPAW
jgi:hypothetical protein